MLVFRAPATALTVLVLAAALFSGAAGQQPAPAAVFRPALDQIRSQTHLPILLPTKLPSNLRENDIKLAVGEIRKDGYFISLFFADPGSNANYAAGFGASSRVFRESTNTVLANGRAAIFRPISCGGSCAPANLWWEQNGVEYNIQVKLRSNMRESDQRRILVETANASVSAR